MIVNSNAEQDLEANLVTEDELSLEDMLPFPTFIKDIATLNGYKLGRVDPRPHIRYDAINNGDCSGYASLIISRPVSVSLTHDTGAVVTANMTFSSQVRDVLHEQVQQISHTFKHNATLEFIERGEQNRLLEFTSLSESQMELVSEFANYDNISFGLLDGIENMVATFLLQKLQENTAVYDQIKQAWLASFGE